MGLQGSTERGAALDRLQNALQQLTHGGFVTHLDEHAQSVVQRQPGTQHDGQLRGEGQNIFGLDGAFVDPHLGRTEIRPLCGRSHRLKGLRNAGASRLLCILHGQWGQPLATQLANGRDFAGSTEPPGDHIAV